MNKGTITVDKIPGGHYTCQDNGDGTWNILDVPIMGEMFEGEKGVPFDLGKTWHEAALRKAGEREDDGHWGSVHINHHEKGLRTERAGFLRLRRVGTLQYEKRDMSCLYADLLRVPKHIFDLVDRGELPYMSVEIASWQEPEIASLAIMPDETPFFRLPMLTTGKKVKAEEPIRCKNSPALALANASGGGFILFKLGGHMDPKDEKKPDAKPEASPKDEKKPETKPVDERPATFGRAPVEQHEDIVDAAEVAKLSAKIDKLEADNRKLQESNEKRERTDKVAALVAKAHEDLKGYYLSADTKAKLQKYAERDLTGESLNDFVSTYKSVASPDETGSEAEPLRPMSAPSANEPEALAKLAAKSPEMVARGREIYAEYLQAKSANYVPLSMTFERYLDINLSLPALKVRK